MHWNSPNFFFFFYILQMYLCWNTVKLFNFFFRIVARENLGWVHGQGSFVLRFAPCWDLEKIKIVELIVLSCCTFVSEQHGGLRTY